MHTLVAIKMAWMLGVEAKLEPALHCSLAKVYFDMGQWTEALKANEVCAHTGVVAEGDARVS